MSEQSNIIQVDISEKMKTAYIDYSMSVIVSRALPDVRDGLKPVQRRVLFGMNDLGILSNRAHKKSARIVGEVLGKYHPHGDSSVYFAMVRMAQEWSLRYPLVDGQGNFGSVDGDSPAAMRYTEARLSKIAEETLSDLEKKTVDFQLNFDDTLEEPTVLPTRIPNLLVNGASGIAVGMATNMPPHNLTEVINATIALIDNEDIAIEDLLKYVKAPDFPTGGIIYGYEGVRNAFMTGRGRIVIRGKCNIEIGPGGREKIIVNEIPYMVNKAELIQKVDELVNDKKIEGISSANDESDRTGMRIVFEVKRDAVANVVLNNLYKYTQLQSTFSVNNICLVHGRPKLLNLKELIHYFVEHRHDVVLRRSKFELDQAEKRAHILEGLLIALDHLDEVISLIRGSKNPDEAREGLIEKFGLSEIQARAILDMRLHRLTGLERDKIREEYDEVMKLIEYLRQVIEHKHLRSGIIKEELLEIKEKFGDERRTDIVYASEELNPEDFYADEEVVITITNLGYIKRTPLTEFRTQNRGGKGAMGSSTREEDFLRHLYIATMHNTMLFFTEKGRCFWLKVYEIPEGTKTSKGRAIQNLLNIEPDDYIKAYMRVKTLEDKEYIQNNYIVMCTKNGIIKKTSLEEYSRPRQNGINAITLKEENDHLLEAKLTDGSAEIVIAVKSGKAIRFNESTVRPVGRTSMGVRGVTLEEDDRVVGMVCVGDESEDILVISEAGYGKRSKITDYRITNRGGKGVKTFNISDKTGKLIGIKSVTDNDDLMIITKSGLTIRLAVSSLRTTGRATQGVRLIDLKDNDRIAGLAKVDKGDAPNVEEKPESEEDFDGIETIDNEQLGTEIVE
jgi:DNA gyrase subunit A